MTTRERRDKALAAMVPRAHSSRRVFGPHRFVATNDLLTPQYVCFCARAHRDPFTALCCLRRWREQRLIVRCVKGDSFADWPLELYDRVKGYCASLGLSLEQDCPQLFREHAAARAQQSLPLELEPQKPRSGAAWLTKASTYK